MLRTGKAQHRRGVVGGVHLRLLELRCYVCKSLKPAFCFPACMLKKKTGIICSQCIRAKRIEKRGKPKETGFRSAPLYLGG
jgi:hypothetical protein